MNRHQTIQCRTFWPGALIQSSYAQFRPDIREKQDTTWSLVVLPWSDLLRSYTNCCVTFGNRLGSLNTSSWRLLFLLFPCLCHFYSFGSPTMGCFESFYYINFKKAAATRKWWNHQPCPFRLFSFTSTTFFLSLYAKLEEEAAVIGNLALMDFGNNNGSHHGRVLSTMQLWWCCRCHHCQACMGVWICIVCRLMTWCAWHLLFVFISLCFEYFLPISFLLIVGVCIITIWILFLLYFYFYFIFSFHIHFRFPQSWGCVGLRVHALLSSVATHCVQLIWIYYLHQSCLVSALLSTVLNVEEIPELRNTQN